MKKLVNSKRILKISLIVSLIVNLFFITLSGIFIHQRGGLNYVIQQSQSVFGLQTESIVETRTPDYLRRLSVHETLPIEKGSVVFLGDSIIAGVEWFELMDDDTYINRGIPGDDSEGVMNRLDNILEESPDSIMLMFGVNDLYNDGDNNNLLVNYRNVINIIKTKSPMTKVYIHSILPYNTEKYTLSETTRMSNELIADTNECLKDIANDSDAKYIDLYSLLVGENGELNGDFTFDGLHLNGDAYEIWGEILEKEFQ